MKFFTKIKLAPVERERMGPRFQLSGRWIGGGITDDLGQLFFSAEGRPPLPLSGLAPHKRFLASGTPRCITHSIILGGFCCRRESI
jgi:hypothetical protein